VTSRDDDFDPELLDEPIEPAEQLEADRLARALDERAEREPPRDALEAGFLLRVLHDGGLAPEREKAILDELLRVTPRPRTPSRRGFPWTFLFAGLGVSALAVVLVLDRTLTSGSAPPVALSLPQPSVELLEAQAAGLTGQKDSKYTAAMADYRRDVLGSFRRREGDE
jgi:hypothetical protein